MAVDYGNYTPDLGNLRGYSPEQQRIIRQYFNKPRSYKSPYGLGFKLPKIGGLRLRRGQTTPFGQRDLIVDQQGRVYGTVRGGSNLSVGRSPQGGVTLVRRPRAGATPAVPGTTPTQPTPPPDEYASYEKDYPWIATYLRGLRSQEQDFSTRYQQKFEPGLRAAVENIGRIGEGAADRYKALSNAGTAAFGAAANVAPVQIASTSGPADPYALRRSQAAPSAMADQTQAVSSYNAALSALAPVTAGQSILRNIASQYASMSKAYADKRIEDRLKLDQWIEEQKAAAADRKIKQQYNMAMLGLKEADLNLEQQKIDIDAAKARNEGQKTAAELLTSGFRRVPKGAGPKTMAKIQGTIVSSSDTGEQFFKPQGGGGGGGSAATPAQRQRTIADLANAYIGQTTDQMGNVIGVAGGGIRTKASPNDQAGMILSWVETAIRNGLINKTQQDVAAIIDAAIPSIEYPTGAGTFAGSSDPRKNKQYVINLVIGSLRKRKVIK
jgi:ribosomal protein L20